MSLTGGQNGQKNGGAHVTAHEHISDNRNHLSACFVDANGVTELKSISDRNGGIQDGGGDVDSIKTVTETDSLSFSLSTEDLGVFERHGISVVYDTGWLKTRSRSLDITEFAEINDNETVDKSASKDHVTDLIFGPELVSDEPADTSCANTLSLVNSGDCLATTSFVAKLPNIQLAPMPNQNSRNVTEVVSLLSGTKLDKLVSDKKSDIDVNNKNVYENGKIIDFTMLDSDRSNMLMTAHELETMPDEGLEFEESVGPKPGSASINLNDAFALSGIIDNCGPILITDGSPNIATPYSIVGANNHVIFSEPNLANANINLQNIAQNHLNDMVVLKQDTLGQNKEEIHAPTLGSANLTLATISISTDKSNNSTQILVNTTQGQRTYHINTADLTQATNLVHSVAEDGPMSISRQLLQVPMVQGNSVSTGLFLLPVADIGNSGILANAPCMGGSSDEQEDSSDPSSIPGKCEKLYICAEPGCRKAFKKLSKFKIHEMRHTGERPFKCPVAGCDWAFITAYKLRRHEESHEGVKKFLCGIQGCGRKFSTIYNLKSHKRLHERPCDEVCPEAGCGEKFQTKRQLNIHMKSHTGLEKTYKCPVVGCDKVFFSSFCMGSHARVHQQDPEELVCDFEGCGRVFEKLCRLKQHRRCHTGEKPYVCKHKGCTWAFITASKLKRHESKHTGVRKWHCDICGKSFMRPEHLKGHRVTHSGDKPFVCMVEGCAAKFTARSSLYVHLKKHDQGGKTIIYHCPMEGCDKKYNCKANLRSHIMKHYQTVEGSIISDHFDLMLESDELGDESVEKAAPSDGQINQSTGVGGVIPVTLPSPTLATPEQMLINPSEYIMTGTADQTIIADSISDCMVSQLIELQQKQYETGRGGKTTAAPQPKQKLPIISNASTVLELEEACRMMQKTSSGSARTDYKSNHLYSEKARRRRKLQREKGRAELDDMESMSDECSTVDLVKGETLPTYTTNEMLTSRGITFRDPETGVTYVQTQLLQDDPPNPDIFTEDSAMTDIASLHDTSRNGLTDAGVSLVAFTETTINLQDLA